MEAYHSAARLLAAELPRTRLRRFGSAPVVFLYRHALELQLKELLISGQRILEIEGKSVRTIEEILKAKHRLQRLWSDLEDMYKQIGWMWDCDISQYCEIITDLDKVDQESHGFRYPIDLKNKSALRFGFNFDLRRFCRVMEVVLRQLRRVSGRIAQAVDGLEDKERDCD